MPQQVLVDDEDIKRKVEKTGTLNFSLV